jgi:hypothetical protein
MKTSHGMAKKAESEEEEMDAHVNHISCREDEKA